MSHRILAFAVIAGGISGWASAETSPQAPVAAEPPSRAAFRLPLAFEPNVGQTAPCVRFLARAPHAAFFLTDDESVLAFAGRDGRRRSLRMQLRGAGPGLGARAVDRLPGRVHHYVGSDPSAWRSGIPTFAAVRRDEVYPGTDLLWRGDEGRLEYDFLLAPDADPSRIALVFPGADGAEISPEDGALVLRVKGEDVRQERPFAWQDTAGGRREVTCAWTRRGAGAFGFDVGERDPSLPLVIDPVIVYATYLGGLGADAGEDVAVDAAGRAYVVGTTTSMRFPTANADEDTLQGAQDAFVTKLERDGTAILFSTYLGGATNPAGTAETTGRAIAVDTSGAAYVTGWTKTIDFPTTAGAFQRQGPGTRRNSLGEVVLVNADGFVAKLDAGGALQWATYLGGTGDTPQQINDDDFATGIAVDAAGSAHVTGQTRSTGFPVTSDAFQPFDSDAVRVGNAILENRFDAFFVRLSPDGASLGYGTYLGGTLDDGGPGGRLPGGTGGIALDPAGNVYVAGRTESGDFPTTPNAFRSTLSGGYDAFAARFSRLTGDQGVTYQLSYASFLGGTADEGSFARSKFDVFAQAQGRMFVAGDTRSNDFPVTGDAFQPALASEGAADGFVVKIDTTASRAASLEVATYLGGAGDDLATAIGVEGSGAIYAAGRTSSVDFPRADPVQQFLRGPSDAFVTKLSPGGTSLIYSTYLGGRADDGVAGIAVLSPDDAFVTGDTSSTDFPVSGARLQGAFAGGPSDAFLVKLSDEREPVAHDLATLGIQAPRRVRLNARNPARTQVVAVRIQNRSTHAETIPDLETLGRVVQLTVESLGACPPPAAVPRGGPQARRLPLTLRPGDRFTVYFDVRFDCANDPVRSTRRNPGHHDYGYRAQVRHEALDGQPDDHPVDDVCPRPPTDERDPYPDGSFRVTGCPPVFTDVEDRRVR